MNIQKAIKIAMEENKEIALPSDEHCIDNGYHIRLKPFSNNLQLLEFYGDKRKLDHFNLTPREIISDDWMVV